MKNKGQLEPRKLMEMAIEVMRQSVPEPRSDGKASPAIVIFAQRTVQKSPEPDLLKLKSQCL